MTMPICRFCGRDRKLIDAHIIPRGFYPSPAEEGIPRLVTNAGGTWPKKSPTGAYDQSILCADCDGYLGNFDQHAIEKLLNTNAKTELFGRHAYRYDNADANLVELFVASVAWRASVTSHEFFKVVDLGPYSDRILAFLKSRKPEDSPVKMFMAEFDVPRPPFLNPHYLRMSGVQFLIIYASRFIFYLKVDQKPTPADFRFAELHDGNPVIAIVREWGASKERSVLTVVARAPQNQKLMTAWRKIFSA